MAVQWGIVRLRCSYFFSQLCCIIRLAWCAAHVFVNGLLVNFGLPAAEITYHHMQVSMLVSELGTLMPVMCTKLKGRLAHV